MSDGIIPVQLTRNQYIANGTDDTFTYSFYIPENQDLLVILTIDDEDFPQLLDTNYVVTGAGDTAGGTIVFQTDYIPADGDIVTIMRDVPASYDFNFAAPKRITGQNLDNAFISDILLAQQAITSFLFQSIKYSATTYFPTLEAVDPTIVPRLNLGEFWIGGAFGNITKASASEPPDCSTLRTDLANEDEGTDGSRLVGYYDSDLKQSMTVHDALDEIFTNAANGAFSLQSATYSKIDTSLNIQQLNYRSVSFLTITKITNEPFVAGTGNGSNIGSTTPTGSYAAYLLTGVSAGIRNSDIGTCALSDTPILPPNYQNKYLIGYFVFGYDSVQCENELTFIGDTPATATTYTPSEIEFPTTVVEGRAQSAVQEMLSIPDLSIPLGFNFYKCYLEFAVNVLTIRLQDIIGEPGWVNFLIAKDTAPSLEQAQSSPYNFLNNIASTSPVFGSSICMNTIFPAYRGSYNLKLYGQCGSTDIAVTNIGVVVYVYYRITTVYLDLTDSA